MAETPNYGLALPAETDYYNIDIFNANATKIDTALKTISDAADQTGEAVTAAKSTTQTVTLTAANWTGDAAPYTYRAAFAIMGMRTNGFLAVAQEATAEQREAARAALLSVTGRTPASGNYLTITADGDKPTVDIPVTLIMLA